MAEPHVISQDVRSGQKPDRNLALELVRVTEAAALASARWVGRGNGEAADQAAVDAMRLMLHRPRHEEAVEEVRGTGARIRFISDGDVAAALLAVTEGTGIDLLWGIGGTPEGVLSAGAIKCLGGRILGRLWPRDDDERRAAEKAGY